jgi:hypothetical protein
MIDLRRSVTGGEQSDITLGANWYVNQTSPDGELHLRRRRSHFDRRHGFADGSSVPRPTGVLTPDLVETPPELLAAAAAFPIQARATRIPELA